MHVFLGFFVPLSVSQLIALVQQDRGKISGGSEFQISDNQLMML